MPNETPRPRNKSGAVDAGVWWLAVRVWWPEEAWSSVHEVASWRVAVSWLAAVWWPVEEEASVVSDLLAVLRQGGIMEMLCVRMASSG